MPIRRQFSNAVDQPNVSGYSLATAADQPQTILEKIVWHKQREVLQMAAQLPLPELIQQVSQVPPALDFVAAIRQASGPVGLIAEVKKASPSRGIIRADFDPVTIAQAYARGGAACLSVLTDRTFFQGGFNSLWQIRQQVTLPLLCKEFVISLYQVWMARAAGADAVLLIAAVLCDDDLRSLSQLIRSLGMRSLIEVHTLAELDRVLSLPHLDMVGINNRDLEDFSIDLTTTQQLLSARRSELQRLGVTVVSESGIHNPADLAQVSKAGAAAVLVGESLVKQPDIEAAVQTLLAPVPALSL